MVFGAHVLGYYLHMEDMSLPRSESEWTDLFTGTLRTHHLAERGVRAELSLASANPYLAVGYRGISRGEMGVRPPFLSATPVWPHGSISHFRCNPLCGGGGVILRAGCRMRP
jgi:hypothetical protein